MATPRGKYIPVHLLTVDELAEELGVTRRTVERWHSEKVGPPRIKLGKRVFYRPEQVREWIISKEQN